MSARGSEEIGAGMTADVCDNSFPVVLPFATMISASWVPTLKTCST
jgi:hypothetical protein